MVLMTPLRRRRRRSTSPRALQTHPRLAGVNRLSIFISPLSKEEIVYLKAPERNVLLQELLTDIMRRKLSRWTRRQNGDLSAPDLENVETRLRCDCSSPR
jgi:guanylate kinase